MSVLRYAGEYYYHRHTTAAPAEPADFPVVTVEVAFDVDPNDPDATPTWTDISDHVRRLVAMPAARSYELDRFDAGTLSMVVNNEDGRFTPGNTAGLYYPNVKPMRRIRLQATWDDVTYDIFTGYVEAWPQEWEDGLLGMVNLTAVDPLAVIAQGDELAACYVQEVLRDTPIAYYPLTEPADSQGWSSLVGQWPQATRVDSKYGAATVTSGVDGVLSVEPETALQFSGANGVSKIGSVLQLAVNGVGPYIDNNAGTGWAMELWFQMAASITDPGYLIIQTAATAGSGTFNNGSILLNTDGTITVFPADSGNITADDYDDTNAHHVVLTFEDDGKTWHLHVDGVEALTGVNATAFGSSNPRPGWLHVGGLLTSGAQQQFLSTGAAVTVAHVAIYDTEVTEARALAHYTAGHDAFAGEASGTRISRLLAYADYTGPTDVDTGNSEMGPLTGLAGLNPLAVLQDTAQAENGELRATPAGELRFAARSARYNLDVSYTFGDDQADADELKHRQGVEFDYDDTLIHNQISLSRPAGSTIIRDDVASKRTYFRRPYSATLNVSTAAELEGAADYRLARDKDPGLRLKALTIMPGPNHTDLWPVVLGLAVGERLQLTRRPGHGADAIELDQIVEGVSHVVTPRQWVTTVLTSPADIEQYWELGVAGFSELGETTTLAY